jgi:acetyl-CoA acyltransferase 2
MLTKKPLSRAIYIVAAKRTPFGNFGGSLKDLTATDLAVVAAKAALAAGGVSPEIVDAVCIGNVSQTSADALYMARHVGLRSGVPVPAPALTVNRLCGSGFQAIVNGAQDILLGDAEVVLVGGTENMSQAPHVVRGARWGLKFGQEPKFEDTLWSSLTDSFSGCPMAITAENLAEKYKISREECDAYGLRSQ